MRFSLENVDSQQTTRKIPSITKIRTNNENGSYYSWNANAVKISLTKVCYKRELLE